MMKKGNNKGFSLVEIVIGIGMLAVIVIPILHTFITSAKINRDSRQIMIQTEVAQTIMEGFAGKSYADVKTSVAELGSSGSGIVSGNKALSSIDGNIFNNTDVPTNELMRMPIDYNNVVGGFSWGTGSHLDDYFTMNNKSSVTWHGNIYAPLCNYVSDNTVMASMNQAFGDDLGILYELQTYTRVSTGGDPEKIRFFTYWTDPTGDALFIGYGNIHYEGYYFDAVVSLLPMAHDEDDMYYTYKILLTLYEFQPGWEFGSHLRFKHALMTMDGGIMSIDNSK